jgi:small subunit ribosomal protein S9
MAKKDFNTAIGRRKSASARVKLISGSGNITINKLALKEYTNDSKYLIDKLNEPFLALDIQNKFDISVIASGGGLNGQIEATRLGISKCLVDLNPDYKSNLKKAGLLKRDSREKERKKFGLLGARKKRQFTKR